MPDVDFGEESLAESVNEDNFYDQEDAERKLSALKSKLAFIKKEKSLLKKRRHPECEDSLVAAIGCSTER